MPPTPKVTLAASLGGGVAIPLPPLPKAPRALSRDEGTQTRVGSPPGASSGLGGGVPMGPFPPPMEALGHGPGPRGGGGLALQAPPSPHSARQAVCRQPAGQ
jgi:hypothetical protein